MSQPSSRGAAALAAGIALLLAGASAAADKRGAAGVVVNGEKLSAEQVARLEALAGTRILPGAYWYDRVSGAWGVEASHQAMTIDTSSALSAAIDKRGRVSVHALVSVCSGDATAMCKPAPKRGSGTDATVRTVPLSMLRDTFGCRPGLGACENVRPVYLLLSVSCRTSPRSSSSSTRTPASPAL